MPERFRLEINGPLPDRILTPPIVAAFLRVVADSLDDTNDGAELDMYGGIEDRDGKPIGHWEWLENAHEPEAGQPPGSIQ